MKREISTIHVHIWLHPEKLDDFTDVQLKEICKPYIKDELANNGDTLPDDWLDRIWFYARYSDHMLDAYYRV